MHMSHFRIDTVKYQRHLEMRTTHYAAAERLLETIGSVPWVQRAVREATATGRLTDSMAEHVDSLLLFLAEYSCPGTLDRPEPAIEPDEASLHELIDHLHQCFELMRFSNFVIPPGLH